MVMIPFFCVCIDPWVRGGILRDRLTVDNVLVAEMLANDFGMVGGGGEFCLN